MEIARARVSDVPGILAISNWAAVHTAANFAIEPEPLEAWEAMFTEEADRFPWFVARDEDGTVGGFARAAPWKGRCAYEFACEISVYVDPAHHRQGLGRRLYEVLLRTLARQGYRRVLAGIALPNDASVRLHEAFGLEQVAQLRRVGWKFGQWHDVGYWEGDLGAHSDDPPTPIRPVADVLSD